MKKYMKFNSEYLRFVLAISAILLLWYGFNTSCSLGFAAAFVGGGCIGALVDNW